MSVLLIFGLFVVSLTIQGSVLALAGTDGTHPDLLLVIVVALALISDARRGAVIGLCAGLLQDILFGSPLGFFAAVKMLTGAAAGLLADDIYKDFTLAPMLLVVFFSLVSDMATFFLMKLYNIPMPFSLLQYLQQFTMLRMFMHFFIMGLIYPYLFQAQKRRFLLSSPLEHGD